jgi:hypothetical protein
VTSFRDFGTNVGKVDNFSQISAATAETSRYFFGEFGSADFHRSRVLSLSGAGFTATETF